MGSYGHGMQKVHLRVFPISGPCSGLPLLLGTAPKLPQPHLFYAYIYIKKSNLREKVLECDCCKKLERGVGAA